MNSLQLARITLRSPQHHRPVPQMMKVNGHARHLLTFFDAPCIMLDNVIQQRRPATKPLEAAHIPTVASLAYLRHERIAASSAPCRMEKHVEIIGIPGAQEKEPPRPIHRRPEGLKRRQSHQPGPIPERKGKQLPFAIMLPPGQQPGLLNTPSFDG